MRTKSKMKIVTLGCGALSLFIVLSNRPLLAAVPVLVLCPFLISALYFERMVRKTRLHMGNSLKGLSFGEYWQSLRGFFTVAAVKEISWIVRFRRDGNTLRKGDFAPDAPLYPFSDRESTATCRSVTLLSLVPQNRPLVLCFGSCT